MGRSSARPGEARPRHPRTCPECGHDTVVRLPRSGLQYVLVGGGVPAILFAVLLLPGVREWSDGLPAAALAAALLLLNLGCRGHRFYTRGFTICPACDRGILGREEGSHVTRAWRRAVAVHQRMLLLLVPVVLWVVLWLLVGEDHPFGPFPLMACVGVGISLDVFLPPGRKPWWRPRVDPSRSRPRRPHGAGPDRPEDGLHAAARLGDREALGRHLAAGADIEERDAASRSALIEAASHGRTDAVAFLLNRGADPDAADANGVTPLMQAAAVGDLKAARLLLVHGAERHRRDDDGDDAEVWAEARGHPLVAAYLRCRRTGW